MAYIVQLLLIVLLLVTLLRQQLFTGRSDDDVSSGEFERGDVDCVWTLSGADSDVIDSGGGLFVKLVCEPEVTDCAGST